MERILGTGHGHPRQGVRIGSRTIGGGGGGGSQGLALRLAPIASSHGSLVQRGVRPLPDQQRLPRYDPAGLTRLLTAMGCEVLEARYVGFSEWIAKCRKVGPCAPRLAVPTWG